jgi:1-acyl-sn-glycerol-3-phosphate acyltransferase
MKQLARILSYPFSVLFYMFFGISVTAFQAIQWVCFNVFGYQAHKKSVDILNWLLLRCLNVLGTRFSFKIEGKLPQRAPVILVSNHQSMWDIPPMIWYLRKLHLKFISKKELGHGVPSISYNLRHGGSVLIDRKQPERATEQIVKISKYISKHRRGVIIFPEGTRSRTGAPKPFKTRGLLTLFEQVQEGYVLPVTVNNSWKLQRYGFFPMPIGVHLKHHVHPAIKISEYEPNELISKIEEIITRNINF